MGVNFRCGSSFLFYTSYSGWGDIRLNVAKATMRYLENKFIADAAAKKTKKCNSESGISCNHSGISFLNTSLVEDTNAQNGNAEVADEDEDDDDDDGNIGYEHYKTKIMSVKKLMKEAENEPELRMLKMRLGMLRSGVSTDTENMITFASFTKVIANDRDVVDAFNHFGCGGVVALSSANDSAGRYTPGNAWDIWSLLEMIHPTLVDTISETDLSWWYEDVKKLFYESWNLKKNVIIG